MGKFKEVNDKVIHPPPLWFDSFPMILGLDENTGIPAESETRPELSKSPIFATLYPNSSPAPDQLFLDCCFSSFSVKEKGNNRTLAGTQKAANEKNNNTTTR